MSESNPAVCSDHDAPLSVQRRRRGDPGHPELSRDNRGQGVVQQVCSQPEEIQKGNHPHESKEVLGAQEFFGQVKCIIRYADKLYQSQLLYAGKGVEQLVCEPGQVGQQASGDRGEDVDP